MDLDRRRRAAALFARGRTRADVARRLGVSRASATRWYRLWKAGGTAALTERRRRGRPPRLPLASRASLCRLLAQPPRALGYDLERWTLAAVAALVAKETGVTYHRRHVGRLLRRWGWIVPPVGRHAGLARRRVPFRDPDGNDLGLVGR